MYIRKKNKVRLFLLLIVALGFIYWRGMREIVKQNHLECEYHFVYAVCVSQSKAVTLPGFWDVLKAGIKF